MLKKISPLLFLIVLTYALSSCKSNKKGEADNDTSIVDSKSVMVKEAEKTVDSSSPATYNAVPDTALLGKSYEAKVKVISMSVMPLKDPDGKSTGSEVTLNLSVTNKSTLDDKKFFSVSSDDARLEMDNGQAIPVNEHSGKTNPDPESTSSGEWKFELPPNAKPAKLHLYLDGTRVTLNLQTK
ncbi:hypothetical protein ABIB40_000634 [Pedobacter sp. UYP30]|uniref:hypothetical protein n=1 Tax=Pedobacter sp. UYP30 TaxID=1756400 RepID=UPI003390E219